MGRIMSVSTGDICITRNDFERIVRLVEHITGPILQYPDGAHMVKELKKAKRVDARKISPEFITMNTTFSLTNLGTGETCTYTLVYPDETDAKKGKISVLSPEGMAAFGYKTGNVICWKVGAENRYLQISRILYQPEAKGEFDS
jgi:regulator of nucleoside diphosphate kinase